jgi:hypothetical protein
VTAAKLYYETLNKLQKSSDKLKLIEEVDFHKNQKSVAGAPIKFPSPRNSEQNQIQIKSNLIDLYPWGKTVFGFFKLKSLKKNSILV